MAPYLVTGWATSCSFRREFRSLAAGRYLSVIKQESSSEYPEPLASKLALMELGSGGAGTYDTVNASIFTLTGAALEPFILMRIVLLA